MDHPKRKLRVNTSEEGATDGLGASPSEQTDVKESCSSASEAAAPQDLPPASVAAPVRPDQRGETSTPRGSRQLKPPTGGLGVDTPAVAPRRRTSARTGGKGTLQGEGVPGAIHSGQTEVKASRDSAPDAGKAAVQDSSPAGSAAAALQEQRGEPSMPCSSRQLEPASAVLGVDNPAAAPRRRASARVSSGAALDGVGAPDVTRSGRTDEVKASRVSAPAADLSPAGVVSAAHRDQSCEVSTPRSSRLAARSSAVGGVETPAVAPRRRASARRSVSLDDPLGGRDHIAGKVRVEWRTGNRTHAIRALDGKGFFSKKGVALMRSEEGQVTAAATAGLVRNVVLSRGTVVEVRDGFLNDGKATFQVSDDVFGKSYVFLSEMHPSMLAALVNALRP